MGEVLSDWEGSSVVLADGTIGGEVGLGNEAHTNLPFGYHSMPLSGVGSGTEHNTEIFPKRQSETRPTWARARPGIGGSGVSQLG